MSNDTKQWFALDIAALPEAAEAIEFALNSLDALGTEINNLGPNHDGVLKIVGYFNEKPPDHEIDDEIAQSIAIYRLDSDSAHVHGWRDVKDQDWLAEWKKHWKPTESERFVIAPTWETVPENGKIVIRIEPSMAFGTGTHETTRLCLKAIEKDYRPGESFLDVGTGTGILAIAVSKLNPSPVRFLACDTDEDSIKIAVENFELNNAPGIEAYVGSITEDSPVFDVVCANVTLDVILPILPLLVAKSGRMLILSGILVEQKAAILEALLPFGCKAPKVETMGEWTSVTCDFEVQIPSQEL